MQISPRLVFLMLTGISFLRAAEPAADGYLWLEEVDSARSMEWVHAHNAVTAARLGAQSGYTDLHRDALAILNSTSRIPAVSQHGGYLYNLWQDPSHQRGLFRRTTLTDFRKDNPLWETVLDIDELSRAEGQKWAFGGATWLEPEERRCLIHLEPGGSDAAEVREFDTQTKAFVVGGFTLPVAKSRVSWRGADSLYVATDFGPGSLTKSGYPRIVKLWKRGTPLAAAILIYEGKETSVASSASRIRMAGGGEIDLLSDGLTFWTSAVSQIMGDRLVPLAVPPTARVIDGFRGRLVVWLKESWTFQGMTFPADAVLLVDPAALRGESGSAEMVVAPTPQAIVRNVAVTPSGLLVATLDNVRSRLDRFVPRASGGWQRETIGFPDNGALNILSTHSDTGAAFVEYQSFLTPPALYYVPPGGRTPEQLKTQAPTFDGARFEVVQNWTVSADGTKVPYFVVGPKGMKFDGENPVWMFSYGGFENALTPAYSGSYEDLHGAYGKLWLERGGVFVLANIRGGGEFGPVWHTSVLKENHYKCYEDFEAVARDLAKRGITSPAHLGIEGRSNGGLLVGSTMLRHPELYGAVVCGNPLLDMRRYTKLLAGASWAGEYGDPDDAAQWAYISQYSPYQNLTGGKKLPAVMFYSTTRDDRVHPGHARKMAARMEALGYPVEYFENIEGGHHGPVVTEQLATRIARTYAFLWRQLR